MNRFGVKDVLDGTFYDLAQNSKPVLFLDSLKMSNLEGDSERTFVTGGKGNGRWMAFDYGKTSTFSLQDALMNPKSIAMQHGAEVVQGVQTVHKREILDVVDNAGTAEATTTEAPVGNVTLYKADSGYETGSDELVTPTGNVVAVTVATAGEQVVAYYQYETSANAEQVVIASDKYSGFYKFVGQTVIRNASTNVDEVFEIEVPKVKITSQFSINLSPDGDPAVFDMNMDVLKNGVNNEMIKLTRVG